MNTRNKEAILNRINRTDYFITVITWSNCLTTLGLTKLKHLVNDIDQIKHSQPWGISHLSSKPIPMSDHCLGKEMHPYVQSEAPLVPL